MFFSKPFKIHPSHDKQPAGKRMVVGFRDDVKPIRGVDEKGQAKLIFAEGEDAMVVVQTETQDSFYRLEDRGDYWIVDKEIRREVLIK